jgi:cell wall assembly regulator SMI1
LSVGIQGTIMAKSKSPSVEESWTRITRWLRSQRKAADVLKKLLPGVPEEALKRVEKKLGVKLPADLRQFWQLCGGSRPDKGAEKTDDEPWWQPGEWSSDFFPRSIPETMAFSILSPRAAFEAWERLQEWEGFDRRLLPIAGDGGSDYQCVNISAKHHGKLVEWSPEEGEAKALAPSLSCFLQQLADGLEQGTIGYQRENGLVHLAPATVKPMPQGAPSPEQIQKLMKMKIATCPVCGCGLQGEMIGLHLERKHGIR